MIPVSPKQAQRTETIYRRAKKYLWQLSDERLNLDPETRDALNRCRGELEEFDRLRCAQPIERGGAL